MKKFDIVYVVASKLGTIGMGCTAHSALTGIKNSKLSYNCFCRGYLKNISLDKKNISNYSFLEYLSYPFRFIDKILKIKINSFRLVNYLFGKMVYWNLPKSKIYHSWMNICPDAIKKAKKNGSILILEGANSHPITGGKIISEEYRLNGKNNYSMDERKIKKLSKPLENFDYVMCPSQFVYDSFLENGFNKNQLIKLPYGVNLKSFKKRDYEKKTKFKFIFVGSFQLRKGVHYLLKAWEELKLENAELLIVGRVWPDSKEIFEKYKDNKSIKFLGFDSDPKKYLSDADVFVSPSLEEGSALTVYEAMASGLPIIATENTGSVIRDKKEGFIIPIRNINVLKQKMLYLYNNPKKAFSMGMAARKYVENFTWKKYGENLVREYIKILKKNEK